MDLSFSGVEVELPYKLELRQTDMQTETSKQTDRDRQRWTDQGIEGIKNIRTALTQEVQGFVGQSCAKNKNKTQRKKFHYIIKGV